MENLILTNKILTMIYLTHSLRRDHTSNLYSPPISLVVQKILVGLSLLTIIWLAPFGVPGAAHLSTKTFIETKEFCDSSFAIRLLYWAFWGQLILTKYVAIWILAEGVMLLGGLGIFSARYRRSIQKFFSRAQ